MQFQEQAEIETKSLNISEIPWSFFFMSGGKLKWPNVSP
jgi:hypothetical protein